MVAITFIFYSFILSLAFLYGFYSKIKINDKFCVVLLILSSMILYNINFLSKNGTDYVIINKTEELISKDFPGFIELPPEKEDAKTKEEHVRDNTFLYGKFHETVVNTVIDYGISFSIAIFIFLFSLLIYKLNILKVYMEYIRTSLFNVNHQWMTENSLYDLVVSINIYSSQSKRSYNLDEFFKTEFESSAEGLYIILANAGEGKTISTLKIASLLLGKNRKKAKHKKRIPVLLNFNDIKNIANEEDLSNIICSKFQEAYKYNILKYFFGFLKRRIKRTITYNIMLGNLLVIFDGYDEINEEKRYDTSRLINSFINNYPKCMYVITSRTSIYLEENFLNVNNDERILYLSPLTKAQIQEFIEKWNFPPNKSKRDLYYKIIENSQLEKISTNPLLLTLISYLYGKSKLIMPNSIAEFYYESLRCLLESWEDSKKIPKRFISDYETKIVILSNIAYELFTTKETSLEKKHMLKIICQTVKDYGYSSNNILEDIYNQSGILDKTDNNAYKFYHRSFMEFFVAKYFINNNIEVFALEDDIKQYNFILFFYYSMLTDEEKINSYIKRNLSYITIVEQLFIECDINDSSLVRQYVQIKINDINLYDANYFYLLGNVASKYEYVSNDIYLFLNELLNKTHDAIVTHNIMTALLYFRNASEITVLIKNNITKIDIKGLVVQADEIINPVLYKLIHDNINIKYIKLIIEGLSETGKSDAMLTIYNEASNDDLRSVVLTGFLQMTNDIFFLEWLKEQDLIQCLPNDTRKVIKVWANKYGWKWNKLSKNQLYSIYTIIFYSINYNSPASFNAALINNRFKFIITYIKNESNTIPVNYLINIKEFNVKSNIEFKYHWKKGNNFQGIGLNPIWLNRILIVNFAISLLILMFNKVYISVYAFQTKEKVYRLIQVLSKKYDLDFYKMYETYNRLNLFDLSISKYFEFNSNFIIYYLLWYILQIHINKYLIEKEYNFFSKCLTVFIGLNFLWGYYSTIQNKSCRLVGLVSMIIVVVIGNLNHKNNYPSFKQPQFGRIRCYLEGSKGNDIL